MNGRSYAASFLEEHDQLQRDLMVERDENRMLREQLLEHAARIDLMTRERDYWRSRCNTYFSYSVELAAALTSLVESVSTGVARAKQIAAEITREKLAAVANEVADDGAAKAVQALSSARGGEMPNAFDAAGR